MSWVGGPNAVAVNYQVGRVEVNHLPEFANQSLSTAIDTPVSFTANDSDSDGDPLSARNFFIPPLHGTVVSTGLDDYIYTPNAGYQGTDTFAYTGNDGLEGIGVAVITVRVGNPTEELPFSVLPNVAEMPFGSPTALSLSISNGSTPSIMPVPGAHGTVTQVGAGQFEYRPQADFFGKDFTAFRDTTTGKIVVKEVTVTPPTPVISVWAGGIYQGSVSGYGSHSGVFDSTKFQDGPLEIIFSVQDSAGGSSTGRGTITIDNTPPETCDYVVPLTPPANSFQKGNIGLQVVATDSGSGIRLVRLVNPSVRDYSAHPQPDNYAVLNYNTLVHSDAPTDFITRCTDVVGNARDVTQPIKIDNTAPNGAVAITPAPTGASGLVRGMRSISATGDDGIGSGMKSVRLYLHGAGSPVLLGSSNGASTVFNLNTAAYSDGSWEIQAEVEDNLSQKRTVTSDITIDNTPPTVTIQAPADGEVVTTALTTINALIDDANGITARTILIDGTPVNVARSGNVYTISPYTTNGIHTLTVRGTDAAGNEGEASRTFVVNSGAGGNNTLSVDFITLTDGAIMNSASVVRVLASQGNDSIERVTLKVNGGASIAMNDTGNGVYELDMSALFVSEGSVSLEATVEDAAQLTVSKAVTITVDNVLPGIIGFSPDGTVPLSGTQNIYLTASDNLGLSSLEIFISHQSQALASRSFSTLSPNGDLGYTLDTTLLANGPATLLGVAVDRAGNTRNFTRQIVVMNNGGNPDPAPTIQVLSPSNNQVVGGITNIKMRVTGANILSAGFTIDGGALMAATETAPGIYEMLWDTGGIDVVSNRIYPDGFHTIGYFAANSGGNAPSTSILARVDNTPPSITAVNPTTNQVLFLAQNLIANANDGAFPLQSVTMKINGEDKAFFPGNSPVSNTLYTYLFDTEETTLSGDRRYPDGSGYTVTMIAEDLAGNRSQTAVPFIIDHSNIPLSNATVAWTPAPMQPVTFAVGPENTFVSATVAGATVDAALLNGGSLRVFATKDGLRQQLSGVVQLNGNTVEFRGTIPYNARISCVLSAIDTAGNLVRSTHEFISGMDKDLGGTITLLPENLFAITILPDGLTEDALVEIVPLDLGQAPAPDLGANEETVYGPVQVMATNSQGVEMTAASAAGRLLFARPVNQIPAPQLSGYFDTAWKFDGTWQQLGNNGNAGGSSADAARTVRAPFTEFGIYRITTAPLPGSGITELFNYPNPFSPSEGGTKFSFLLGDPTGIELTIYDLVGNLVLRRSFSGSAGPNTLPWDGRNGSGDEVGNGGYIAVLTTSEGSRARRKLGVAK